MNDSIVYTDLVAVGLHPEFIGVCLQGDQSEFWKITMPCGEHYTYYINDLPRHDVLCRCGSPTHYVVKWVR